MPSISFSTGMDELDGEDEAIEIPIEDALDLHYFRPAEVAEVVRYYLLEASTAGFSEVRLIHGKGSGALKKTVHAELARNALVVEYTDAGQGNWGATLVTLRAVSD